VQTAGARSAGELRSWPKGERPDGARQALGLVLLSQEILKPKAHLREVSRRQHLNHGNSIPGGLAPQAGPCNPIAPPS